MLVYVYIVMEMLRHLVQVYDWLLDKHRAWCLHVGLRILYFKMLLYVYYLVLQLSLIRWVIIIMLLIGEHAIRFRIYYMEFVIRCKLFS